MASSLSSDSKHQRTDDLSPSASSGPQVSHDDDGQPTKRQCLDSEARARPDPEDSSSVAFVGLGAMGTHLARHLHGYSLSQLGRPALVWNRSPDKALQHATAHGTEAAGALSELRCCGVLCLCLPTTAHVQQVLDEVPLRPGALVIDCTSGDPEQTRALAARLAGRGVRFVDAPVSGGPKGAAAGSVTRGPRFCLTMLLDVHVLNT